MGFKYKVGDEVRITSLPSSIDDPEVEVNTVGVVVSVDEEDLDLTYEVRSDSWGISVPSTWWFEETNLEFTIITREQIIEKISYHEQQIKDFKSKLEITN